MRRKQRHQAQKCVILALSALVEGRGEGSHDKEKPKKIAERLP